MVLDLNEVIEVVVNNKDTSSHPVHIHGHAPQIGAYILPSRKILYGMEDRN
jgi:FtsP/CotA-like multicopper oxidase with cupredoxin domain